VAINSAKMNTRIKIEKRTVSHITGKRLEVWDEYYACWTEVLDLIGQEKYNAYNSKLENSIKFKCRVCQKLKDILFNTKEYRLNWNEQVFNILFVDTLSNSNTEIILQVQKVS
jgi:SPP1 family predicted phage head-tail adaptor